MFKDKKKITERCPQMIKQIVSLTLAKEGKINTKERVCSHPMWSMSSHASAVNRVHERPRDRNSIPAWVAANPAAVSEMLAREIPGRKEKDHNVCPYLICMV